jgi:hypothetical protein
MPSKRLHTNAPTLQRPRIKHAVTTQPVITIDTHIELFFSES